MFTIWEISRFKWYTFAASPYPPAKKIIHSSTDAEEFSVNKEHV